MILKVQFPSISLEEWQLCRQLSDRKTQYGWQNIQADLATGLPPDSIDLQLRVHWQGQALNLLCHQSVLAQWLAPQLQEAALMSLPEPLLLALLEQESTGLPIVWDGIISEPVTTRQHTLSIQLTRGTDILLFWLLQVPESLLAQLDRRPLAKRLPVPLILSLQLDRILLPLSQLKNLEHGDVLLLNESLTTETPLLGVVLGYPWCFLRLHQSTLEVTAMHHPHPPIEQEQQIKNIDELPVDISFEVGRKTLDLHSLSHLQPGSLIDLGCPPDGEVRILVQQRCLGMGRLVNIQNRLGIQVVSILPDSHL